MSPDRSDLSAISLTYPGNTAREEKLPCDMPIELHMVLRVFIFLLYDLIRMIHERPSARSAVFVAIDQGRFTFATIGHFFRRLGTR